MTLGRWLLVAAGAAAGAAVAFDVIGHGGSLTWGIRLAVLPFGLIPGLVAGWAFARRERDVAVPTPVGGAVAALLVALGTPFVAFFVAILIGLATDGLGR
jgi:hypothetical protein